MKTRMTNVMLGTMLAILFATGTGYGDLAAGLIAYYPFNGNANDESGNGNDGTVSGATLTTDRFGNPSSAYSFGGPESQDEIILKYEIPATTEDGSWSVWAKPNHSAWSGGVLGQNYLTVGYLFYFYFDQKIYAGAGDDSTTQVYWDSYTPDMAGQWNHLLLTKSGSTLTLYVNGVNQGQRTMSQITPIASIGIGQGDPYRFDGSIDEVRIYNRALEPSEIQQLAGTAEPTPAEQIQEILDFVYDAVTDGTLVGLGNPQHPQQAENSLQNWIAKLQYARNLAEDDLLEDAYVWLEEAYKFADGNLRPDDHVAGSALSQIRADIEALLDELTPELTLAFETGNAKVYSIPISISDKRMGKALAAEALKVTECALKFFAEKTVPNPWFFVADVLVLVSELYDPVTVAPVGPNMDITKDNEIIATVSPETGDNDYSAVVVLDLLGTGWTETDAASVNSGLTLRAENRYGTEFYGSMELLSKQQLKDLNPYRCYIIAPKSYFQATWPEPVYVFLNAFYEYGWGEDGDIEPLLIEPD